MTLGGPSDAIVPSSSDTLAIVGRERPLFDGDLQRAETELAAAVEASSFLVIGGAGTIGKAVVKELVQRRPRRIHVVDINENNLVELVRDLRSSLGHIDGDFQTLALDCSSEEFEAFVRSSGPHDYVLNLSALKHVRSERDPHTLMRMVRANVVNTEHTLRQAVSAGARKFFAVSSDKAVKPASALGATKRAMEICLMRASRRIDVSTARIANVAFSDGSLLHGFTQRVLRRQPLAAPRDVRRVFVTSEEAGKICIMACMLGSNRELFYPKIPDAVEPVDFQTIAERYLQTLGMTAYPCSSEDEARRRVGELLPRKLWPCFFFDSDTTGEKAVEEFVLPEESSDGDRFEDIGVITLPASDVDGRLDHFLTTVDDLRARERWDRSDLLGALKALVPEFDHKEAHNFLDDKM